MNKLKLRKLRQRRIRAKIAGTGKRPRLNVFRSLKATYAQLIDDESGKTLVAASSKEIKTAGKKTEVAASLGKLIAERALEKGITEAVFDRAGFRYHGRIKSLAEAARTAGLSF